MPAITGRTTVIAHIGHPTASFASPSIYNPWFRARNVDAVVIPLGVRAEEFPAFLPLVARMSNFGGALITMPHKVTVMSLVDEVTPTARIAGAANAVKVGEDGRLLGDQFDGMGFVNGALAHGCAIRGRSALVVGSGGVGSAIAASLAGAGVARLGVHDARPGVADNLAGRIAEHCPGLTCPPAPTTRPGTTSWSTRPRWACRRATRCRWTWSASHRVRSSATWCCGG